MAPLTNKNEVYLSTCGFVSCWLLVWYLASTNGPFRHGRKLMTLHNYIQTTLSVTLFSLVIISLAPLPADSIFTANEAILPRYAYHLSKFYEYVDILLVVANGSSINLHFGFHHLTTPYYTLFRVLNHHRGWQVFAGMNAFHHALMYGFFAGATWTRPMLTYTRYIQLLAGIVCDLLLVCAKGAEESVLGNQVSILLLTCYLVLHTRDIIREELSSQKQE